MAGVGRGGLPAPEAPGERGGGGGGDTMSRAAMFAEGAVAAGYSGRRA